MERNAEILALEDVWAGYGEIVVLKGVSCRVKQGEITSIIGANGAGKSTLLKTIFGIVKPESGKIEFNGTEISASSPSENLRSGISYVPQGRCNFPLMSIRENLEMGVFIRDDDRIEKDIEEMFEQFPLLWKKRKESAGNLSGGQQQILEMAMSLLMKPSLLLIDEPSLGLAPKIVGEVIDTIKAINSNGTTVLMVEQNAKKALSISDHAFVLELGKNWLEGSGPDLLEDKRVRSHYLGL